MACYAASNVLYDADDHFLVLVVVLLLILNNSYLCINVCIDTSVEGVLPCPIDCLILLLCNTFVES